MGSLPTAGLMPRQGAPGEGVVPGPPRGPLATGYRVGSVPTFRPLPSPAGLGSVMKIQPVLGGGSCSDPWGLPPFGIGPLGQGLARAWAIACACTAVATSESVGQQCSYAGETHQTPFWAMKCEPGYDAFPFLFAQSF